MVREVPDYAQQYLIEHPEFGPPLSQRQASPIPCGAGAPAREAATKAGIEIEAQAAPQAEPQTASKESASATEEPAAKRRQTTAHGASRGTKPENDPAPQERKQPQRATQEEENELKRVQAAIAGAERGNWRDLRTVFEFAGISAQNKDAPS